MNEKLKVYEDKMTEDNGNLDGETWNNPCRTCQSQCTE